MLMSDVSVKNKDHDSLWICAALSRQVGATLFLFLLDTRRHIVNRCEVSRWWVKKDLPSPYLTFEHNSD